MLQLYERQRERQSEFSNFKFNLRLVDQSRSRKLTSYEQLIVNGIVNDLASKPLGTTIDEYEEKIRQSKYEFGELKQKVVREFLAKNPDCTLDSYELGRITDARVEEMKKTP